MPSTSLFVIVESLNARLSITTDPVPFALNVKSVLAVSVVILFPSILISSTSILGVDNLTVPIGSGFLVFLGVQALS